MVVAFSSASALAAKVGFGFFSLHYLKDRTGSGQVPAES